MAIKDDKIESFFSSQKLGAFDALKKKEKVSSISPIINRELSVSDSLANQQQSVSNTEANREHSTTIPIPVRELSNSKPLAISEQSTSEPLANPLAKFQIANGTISLSNYSNKELHFLNLLMRKCQLNASLEAIDVSTHEIMQALVISPERVRNIIMRITQKGGVIVTRFKSGQGACRSFLLDKKLYDLLVSRAEQTNKTVSNLIANPLAHDLYSSSNNKITTTTDLPEEWKNIDCTPLEDVMFCVEHLKQLIGRNTSEVVQKSIHHFAFHLETHTPEEPLKLFMGVLRKGQAWIEAKYQSPQERALAAVLQAKKLEQERVAKMEAELIELNFNEWLATQTEEQQRPLVGNSIVWDNMHTRKAALKKYYIENVYKK